jgi:predicted regulator of Ras-like GTPase activity (Roadblock/LC7/MglB family)
MTDLHNEASSGSRSARLDRAIRDLLAQAPELEAAAVVSFDGLPDGRRPAPVDGRGPGRRDERRTAVTG